MDVEESNLFRIFLTLILLFLSFVIMLVFLADITCAVIG